MVFSLRGEIVKSYFYFGKISHKCFSPSQKLAKCPYLSSVWVRLLRQNCVHEVMMLRIKVGCLNLPVHVLMI